MQRRRGNTGKAKKMNKQVEKIMAGEIESGMSFNEKVWALTSRIPAGKVVSYADIARALGSKAYRAVGSALGKNPYAPKVPCHRVLASNGHLNGFMHGLDAKRELLEGEGVVVKNDKVNMKAFGCSLA